MFSPPRTMRSLTPTVQRHVALVADGAEIAGAAPTVGVDLEHMRRVDRDLPDAVLVGSLDPQLGAVDRPTDRRSRSGRSVAAST